MFVNDDTRRRRREGEEGCVLRLSAYFSRGLKTCLSGSDITRKRFDPVCTV